MKVFKNPETRNTLLGILIILLGGGAAIYLLINGVRIFLDLKDTIQAGFIVTILSLAGTLYSLRSTRLKEVHVKIDEQQRSQKRKIYDQFLRDFVDGVMEDDDEKKNELLLKGMQKFMRSAPLWAGEDVLRAFHKFRIDAQQPDSQEIMLLFDFADLILAFRKELGYSNKSIDSKLILDIFLNGVDDAIMQALSDITPASIEAQTEERSS